MITPKERILLISSLLSRHDKLGDCRADHLFAKLHTLIQENSNALYFELMFNVMTHSMFLVTQRTVYYVFDADIVLQELKRITNRNSNLFDIVDYGFNISKKDLEDIEIFYKMNKI